MGFSKASAIGKIRFEQNQKFIKDKAVPYGNMAASNAVESIGTTTNLSNLRAANSNTSQSRLALPFTSVARAGTQSMSASPLAKGESNDIDIYNKLSDRALQDRGAIGSQDIDLTKRKIREVDTIANNEANRAYGMKLDNDNRALGNELATKLPYSAFEENLKSMRQAGNNVANFTQSISGAYNSSISRLNPVSMSL